MTGARGRARGRRPGDTDTRAHILEAARELFAHDGYERASMRAIAARAQVDPALIVHYFGTKRDLLAACLRLPVDPQSLISEINSHPPEEHGEALVLSLVRLWDRPEYTQNFLAMLRAGANDDQARLQLQDTMKHSVQHAVAGLVDDRSTQRAALVMSQMSGLAMSRYFLCIPEIVAMSPEDLATAVGPAIQRYLWGDW
ncbi:MAG: TetR family transcriptional regulator [Candidatus Nanopelagicales bacterium]|jgi:AcrR family transcriptional regulator|nr:TetR family transcriptional regulator [Candidatus Nanopelagicales bacterium]MCU0298558.1 TetR family transcriptional regulator [Candidatus Nanopelagicales bacterium]